MPYYANVFPLQLWKSTNNFSDKVLLLLFHLPYLLMIKLPWVIGCLACNSLPQLSSFAEKEYIC